MKKYILGLLLLVGIITVVACSKDEGNSSDTDSGNKSPRSNWAIDGLYGEVKSIALVGYDNVSFDTISNTIVMTSAKVTSRSFTNYNNSGYTILSTSSKNYITRANIISKNRNSYYIVVVESKMLPDDSITYNYDNKNRIISVSDLRFGNRAYVAGESLGYSSTASSWYNNRFVGDTIYHTYSETPIATDAFEYIEGKYGLKIDFTYDDSAKIATTVIYEFDDDETWKALQRGVHTLNSDGFIDANSSHEYFAIKKTTEVEYENNAFSRDHKERDEKGNWVIKYGTHSNPTMLSAYTKRDIVYY